MSAPSNADSAHELLIRDLATDLKPIRRLRSPSMRTLAWLAIVAATAAFLAMFAELSVVAHRLTAAPDLWLAATGSSLTAILGAFAAFQLSLPDARRAWVLLPLPTTLLWIVASGFGCLRAWFVPGTHAADLSETRDCLIFIIGMSVPLSAVLITMLRRGCPLRPGLTAATAGLATAATAATLLNFCHPFDAAATDLAVHTLAVGLVIAGNRALSGRLLATNFHAAT
jgi:hypothetical protein